MYSCYTPYLFYGFMLGNSDDKFDEDWVEQCGLVEAWDGVIKAHGCSQIIGVAVDYELNDNDTFSLKFKRGQKSRVHKVYDYVKKTYGKRFKFNPPTLLRAVTGDVEICHKTITPRFVINEKGKLVKNKNSRDEDDEEEEEDDEEEEAEEEEEVKDNKKRSLKNKGQQI
eukprot:gene8596-9474_t